MSQQNSYVSNLKPYLQQAWEKANFREPTAIQQDVFNFILDGKDVIAESPTGTGKTVAYLLPLLQKLDENKVGVQLIILASSHELVMQINDQIKTWTEGTSIQNAALIGGANIKRQVEKLKKPPHIIAGTPGRILELIKLKKLKMHHVQSIVLDEGDQLLTPEHVQTIRTIASSANADRQLLLFSATANEKVTEVVTSMMDKPEIVTVKRTNLSVEVKHTYVIVEQREKIEVLRKISNIDGLKGIVFMKDIGNLSVLAEKLQFKGSSIGVLHSGTSKQEREKALSAFRAGKVPLLFATDVAARGLDIPDITHVIHVDVPKETTQYIHRSGRTGRLGSKQNGCVLSIVTESELKKLKQLTRSLDIPIEENIVKHGAILDVNQKIKNK